jgi:5-methylcytosine-specific restriction enzyme A
MPLSIEALYGKEKIGIVKALEIRNAAKAGKGNYAFRCIQCDKPVRPHKEGGSASAHFEHLERNSLCSLSHRAR